MYPAKLKRRLLYNFRK